MIGPRLFVNLRSISWQNKRLLRTMGLQRLIFLKVCMISKQIGFRGVQFQRLTHCSSHLYTVFNQISKFFWFIFQNSGNKQKKQVV